MTKLKYISGDDIIVGDYIDLDGDEGIIELIAVPDSDDWESYKEHGEGVLIKSSNFGLVFTAINEQLTFIKRADAQHLNL